MATPAQDAHAHASRAAKGWGAHPTVSGRVGLTLRVTRPWLATGRAITRRSAISCPVSSFLGRQFLLYLPKMKRDEVK